MFISKAAHNINVKPFKHTNSAKYITTTRFVMQTIHTLENDFHKTTDSLELVIICVSVEYKIVSSLCRRSKQDADVARSAANLPSLKRDMNPEKQGKLSSLVKSF